MSLLWGSEQNIFVSYCLFSKWIYRWLTPASIFSNLFFYLNQQMKIWVIFLADICIFIKHFIKLFHNVFNDCSLTTQDVPILWQSKFAELYRGWLERAQPFLPIGKRQQCQREAELLIGNLPLQAVSPSFPNSFTISACSAAPKLSPLAYRHNRNTYRSWYFVFWFVCMVLALRFILYLYSKTAWIGN